MHNLEELMKLLKITGKTELARKFGKAPSAVTYWGKKGVSDSTWAVAEEMARIGQEKVVDPIRKDAYDWIDRMDDNEVADFITEQMKKAISDKQKLPAK